MASRFCQQQQVDSLFYSQQYELNERLRDDALAVQLSERAITCQSFHDSVLLAPGTVLTGNNEMYKVFTPFRRAFIQRLLMSDNHCVPAPKARHAPPVLLSPLPFDYPQQSVDSQLFPAGEDAALQRLRRFVVNRYRITGNTAICRRCPVPVAYPLIWCWGSFHRVNVLIACGLNPQKC